MPSTIRTSRLSFLHWIRLVVTVIAVVGGLLGMHVMGGAQTAPMATPGASVAAAAPVQDQAASARHVSRIAPPAATTVRPETSMAAAELPKLPVSSQICGCHHSCSSSMAMDRHCNPSFGVPGITAPVPPLETEAVSQFAGTQTGNFVVHHHHPDGPSLERLSISRT